MERPMTEWNDDRLDELNERMKDGFADVDRRFEKVDEHFVRLEGEMKEGFAKVDERFVKVDEHLVRMEAGMKDDSRIVDARFVDMGKRMEAGFERINDRLDRLYGVLIVTAAAVIGTLLANGIWG